MTVTLQIEAELVQPLRVASTSELLQLHPSDLNVVRINLVPEASQGGITRSPLALPVEKDRLSIQNLVEFAHGEQPEGTLVTVWYQGRSESFVTKPAE